MARARAARGARPSGLLALGVVMLVLLAPGGCGYHADVPALPGGAHELNLQRIDNLTDMGELDVRLRAELERRFSHMAHVRLVPAERSALALHIALVNLRIDRSLDPAISAERSFAFTLNGTLTLTDLRTGRALISGAPVSAQVVRLHDPSVLETPAIRDEGLNDVVARFAEEVEQRLFRTF